MGTNSIKARRKLSDLYAKGVEIRFGADADGKPYGKVGPFLDDDGHTLPCPDAEVAMYIRPPDPVQREQAMRDGQAARARALIAAKRKEDSEEHLTIMAFLADLSDESLIDYVLLSENQSLTAEAEREILAYDEWKDMLQYQEAMRQFLEMDPSELENNEEWEALLELDDKYTEQVAERTLELTDAQRDVFRMTPRDQIEKKALDKRSELVGTQAFIDEYERQMLWYAVRDPEKIDSLFFDNPKELAAQDEEVIEVINRALVPFIQDGNEAKNSSGAAAGSSSSALPSEPVTTEASTPQEQSE